MISCLTYVIINEITSKSYCFRRLWLSLLGGFWLRGREGCIDGFLWLWVPVLAKYDVVIVLRHIVSQIVVLGEEADKFA